MDSTLVDYLTVMPYIALLPSLLCGLALSIHDIRRTTVPRSWVAAGLGSQLAVNAVYAALHGDVLLCVRPVLWACCAALLMFLLACVRPGGVGMGDVTSSIMAGHAVGVYGVTAFMGWWALMGMLGLVWMAVLVRLGRSGEGRGPREVPFVPPIMVAALCSVFLG